jgi:hypothetical protein
MVAGVGSLALLAVPYWVPHTAWGDPDLLATHEQVRASPPLERRTNSWGRRRHDVTGAELAAGLAPSDLTISTRDISPVVSLILKMAMLSDVLITISAHIT